MGITGAIMVSLSILIAVIDSRDAFTYKHRHTGLITHILFWPGVCLIIAEGIF